MTETTKSHRNQDDGFKLLGVILSVVFLVFIGACGMRSSSKYNDKPINEKCFYLGGYEMSCKADLHCPYENFYYKEENDKKLGEDTGKPVAQKK